jgi:hypothetical protein
MRKRQDALAAKRVMLINLYYLTGRSERFENGSRQQRYHREISLQLLKFVIYIFQEAPTAHALMHTEICKELKLSQVIAPCTVRSAFTKFCEIFKSIRNKVKMCRQQPSNHLKNILLHFTGF